MTDEWTEAEEWADLLASEADRTCAACGGRAGESVLLLCLLCGREFHPSCLAETDEPLCVPCQQRVAIEELQRGPCHEWPEDVWDSVADQFCPDE